MQNQVLESGDESRTQEWRPNLVPKSPNPISLYRQTTHNLAITLHKSGSCMHNPILCNQKIESTVNSKDIVPAGSCFGVHLSGPSFCTRIWCQIYVHDLGARLGRQIWVTDFGARIMCRIWVPDWGASLGAKFGYLIWAPDLGARISCHV